MSCLGLTVVIEEKQETECYVGSRLASLPHMVNEIVCVKQNQDLAPKTFPIIV